jgi:hypothetical protein
MSLLKTLVHLERLALARRDGERIEPDRDTEAVQVIAKSAGDVRAVDPGVAEEGVPLTVVGFR